MSSYTMQLREYIEQATQNQEGLSTREKIEKGRKKLFDFKYPIFDEEYRNVFETNFIRNFYMREIGFETEELFKFRLETWLLINMPYFNKLFESELIEFDPLMNSEMNVTHNKTNDKTQTDQRDKSLNTLEKGKIDSTNQQTSNTSGTSHMDSNTTYDDEQTGSKDSTSEKVNNDFERELESNNPDSRLAITTQEGKGIIEYASQIDEKTLNKKENNTVNVTDSKNSTGNNDQTTDSHSNVDSTSNVTGNEEIENNRNTSENDQFSSDINEIEDYVQHRIGKIGVQSYSKMLQEFRSSFIRVEQTIFKEMQELFMMLY